jgi:uncharacterized protein YPO0396
MKKITRLLLINWHYFQNTIIDFGTINFLTGKNSAGKSTIIDALQVVLMGETRSTAFNRAASKKSERTLKSYLIGSMGEDVENGNKSIREGKDFSTYIVAEFYDDNKSDYFCLGAVFDTFSDGGDINKRFFYLHCRIPECKFIESGKTMDSRRMSQYFKEKYPKKYETKDTAEGYKNIILTKLNIHERKFFTMLKKAISFEPINDIEKFITENVCDIEDDIDITSMQENILYYKQQEVMAQSFENKLTKLEDICNLYSEIEKLRSRRKIQQFLIDYGTYKDFVQQLEKAGFDLKKYNEDIEEFRKEYDNLNTHIDQLEKEREKLEYDKNKYWTDKNGDWLESEKKRLLNEVEEYGNSVSKFILDIKTSSVRWLDKLTNCIETIDDEDVRTDIEQVRAYLQRTEKLTDKDFELLSPEFFGKIRDTYMTAKDKLVPVLTEIKGRLINLRTQADELKKQITALKGGVKPYPHKAEKLKQAIREGLKQKYNRDISVDFLADMIEITDEEWHNAVEGYLNTQRMNIIVPPQYFMDAYEIYKEARKEENIHQYAIVDLQKVYEYGSTPKENSLANIVRSEDKYVQSYINFLLGKVMRCYSDDKLRDFRTSVTRDCMLYSNFSVKPLNQDAYNNPYIGRNSIQKQIETKTKLLNEITKSIDEISTQADALNPFVSDEWFLAENYISSAVTTAFSNYENKKQSVQKLDEIQKTLDQIDLFWLEEMDKKIEDKKRQIKAAFDKKEETSNFIREFERERDDTVSNKIPQLKQNIAESKQAIDDKYSAEYQETTGIARYENELAECGSPSGVTAKFISPVKATSSIIAERECELTDKRSAYNSEEKTSFKVSDVSDNDEYEKAYQKIMDYELPKYKERIEHAKNEAMEQFRSDFLYKLRANIQSSYDKIDELNRALKIAQFGNDTYKFKIEPNPAYYEYYDMIMSDLLENGNVGLFSCAFTDKYQTVIDNLFAQIISLDGDPGKTTKNVEIFSKYKTYLTFDLLSTDSNGRTDKLSKSIFTKSGGETQTPFYIAVLASFAQLYKVNGKDDYSNTARIVIFDEAFNKMDGERITESVRLLRKFGLQAIICSPPEKAADIAPVSDKTLLVHKDTVGNIYKSTVIEWTKEMSEI